jgi:anti-anti-sigma factor
MATEDWRESLHRCEFFCELVEGDDPAIVIVGGNLTMWTVPHLEACVEFLGADVRLNVLVDLEHLTYCDPSGTSALITICRRVRGAGGSASIICPSRRARLTFSVAGVLEYLADGDNPGGDSPTKSAFGR